MKNLIILIYFLTIPFIGLSQKGIELCYEITPDLEDNSLLHVQARIVNLTSDDVYFLSESCNELDYYIKTISPDVESYIMMHCNATFPQKERIKAYSEYTFKSMLKVKNNSNNLGLNLILVLLNSETKVKGKFISNIRNAYVLQTIELKGQLLK